MKNTIFQLKNDNGLIVEFVSQGAKITSIKVPDNKSYVDVVLGYDTIEEIIAGDAYFGAMCGRIANRIANGKFELKEQTYQLKQNDGTNALHGGPDGFFAKYWNVTETKKEGCTSAYSLTHISPDGDENYPGELSVELIYSLNNDNEFSIDIKANTDKTTIVNLTSHPYFNLKGIENGDILDHQLQINANAFTPLTEISIPTGEIRKVDETAMDFRTAKPIKEAINSDYEQIKMLGGIDHNWVLNKKDTECVKVLTITDPDSKRTLELHTTQPGVQLYTAMHFDGTEAGKNKVPFTAFGGIAIEAQNFADAINHENFPNSVLTPEDTYEQKIIYKFEF